MFEICDARISTFTLGFRRKANKFKDKLCQGWNKQVNWASNEPSGVTNKCDHAALNFQSTIIIMG